MALLTGNTANDRIGSMANDENAPAQDGKRTMGTFGEMSRKITPVVTGLVAFFDVLGYKQMLASNELEQVNVIIRDVLHSIPADINSEHCVQGLYGVNPDYLILSDSELVYQTLESSTSEILKSPSAHRFIRFCSQLTGKFLEGGLPVRGAIAKGKFSVVERKTFAGKPIIEAMELAENLELAGCAIVPAYESEILADKDNRKEVFLWQTPLKSSTQEILMLDYSPFFKRKKSGLRAALIECFGKFKKGISPDVYPKFNNTLGFLKE